jgi:ABC-2 type transport system permease protein
VSLAVLRAMLLGLVRDPGALAMSFALPAVFFVVFASIFAGASGDEFRLRIAMADEVRDDNTSRLLEALAREPSLSRISNGEMSSDHVRRMVRQGAADVGLVVRADGESLGTLGGFGPPPLLIITDPAREIAVPMLAGQIQKAYFSALPDVALGSVVSFIGTQFIEFDEVQKVQIGRGLSAMRSEAERATDPRLDLQGLYEREDVAGQSAALNHVAYYAGAVAVLFLLFSAVHGAITLLEENETGIMDRVLAGPGSTTVLVDGKFLYLIGQGTVQVGVIFTVAWLFYGVDLPRHFGAWLATTVIAAAAAAGIGLVLTTLCSTRRQAQTLSNVVILILSALGGSMVPRFLMPPLLQDLGWLTPNTWALEAYTSIFWRDEPISELLVPWAMLTAAALAGLLISRRLARRLESL